MADSSASRFGLEAVFLILLAVAVGFADLDTWLIAVVMGGGWLLVSLVEWLAWRTARPAPPPILPSAQVQELPAAGWDVQEIIAPVVDEPQPEEPTTVLPKEAEAEPRSKRRWLRMRGWRTRA